MSVSARGNSPRERSAASRPAALRDLEDAGAAFGMARRDDREQPGEGPAQPPVRLDQHRLLAGMGRGAGDDGALADRCPQGRQAVGVGGRLRHVELEIAGGGDARRAELAVTLGMGGRLREAEIEAAQQRGDRGGNAPPAIERALRHAAVDQDQRNAALGAGHDQVRPQIGLDEQREIGPPMVEEALDEARRVENHELVDHALGQALLGEIGRGDGARRAQHSRTLFSLMRSISGMTESSSPTLAPCTHTSGPERARDLAFAVAFVEARGELLAVLEPMRDERRRKRRRCRRQQPIGVQRQRQAAQPRPPSSRGRSAMA